MLRTALSRIGVAMMPTAVVCAVPPSFAHAAEPLEQYAWRYRPLLVFAPDEGSPQLADQRALLERMADELARRDIIVIEVTGEHVSTLTGPASQATAAALRAKFDVSPGEFAVALGGKDLRVKFRSAAPVAVPQILASIDEMTARPDRTRS